jgi:O-antigen ligase
VATELNRLPHPGFVAIEQSVETNERPGVLARLLNRLIFFSLLLLLVLVAVPYGTVEPWSQAFFECAIFALTALWIIEGWRLGSWQIADKALLFPLIALVGFALLQAIPYGKVADTAGLQEPFWQAISADPYNTVRFSLKLIALILAGQLLLAHTTTQKRLRLLIMTIIGVAIGSALFGLLRQTVQRDIMGFLLPYLPLQAGYGQFINSNHFAFLMELALGLPLSFILSRSFGRERWLLFAGLASPLLLAFVLSNSRGGLLGLCSQLLFILLLSNYGRRSNDTARGAANWFLRISSSRGFRLLVGGLLVVILLIGITWVGGDPLITKLEAVSGEISEEGDRTREGTRRIDIWRATRQMVAENPLVGVGFGGYWVAIPQYHRASGKLIPQEAHNDYLEVVASGGVIGAGIVGWFLVAFLRRSRQQLQAITSERQRVVCVGALAGIFAVLIHSLVDFGLHITINALVFTALIVISISPVTRSDAASQSKNHSLE